MPLHSASSSSSFHFNYDYDDKLRELSNSSSSSSISSSGGNIIDYYDTMSVLSTNGSLILGALLGTGVSSPNDNQQLTAANQTKQQSTSMLFSAAAAAAAAASPTSDSDYYYTPDYSLLSTPLAFILFLFLFYIVAVLILFMFALYSHRKSVGYAYDECDAAISNAGGLDGDDDDDGGDTWSSTYSSSFSSPSSATLVKFRDAVKEANDNTTPRTGTECECDEDYECESGASGVLLVESTRHLLADVAEYATQRVHQCKQKALLAELAAANGDIDDTDLATNSSNSSSGSKDGNKKRRLKNSHVELNKYIKKLISESERASKRLRRSHVSKRAKHAKLFLIALLSRTERRASRSLDSTATSATSSSLTS